MSWQTVTHKKHTSFLALTVLLTFVFSWQCNLEFWSDGVFSRELFASKQKDRKRLPSTHIFPSKHLLSVFYLPQEFDAKHEIKQVEQFFTSVLKKVSILRRGWRIYVWNMHCTKSSLTHWQINLVDIIKCTARWWVHLSCNRKQKLPF